MESAFKGVGIYFSTNEEYTVVTTKTSVVVIGTKTGQKLFKQPLPHVVDSKKDIDLGEVLQLE
jgi:hypothetical protein